MSSLSTDDGLGFDVAIRDRRRSLLRALRDAPGSQATVRTLAAGRATRPVQNDVRALEAAFLIVCRGRRSTEGGRTVYGLTDEGRAIAEQPHEARP